MTRLAVAFLVGVLLVAPLSSAAEQPSPSVPLVGVLSFGSSSSPAVTRLVEAFREALREFGYIEGQTIKIESRYAEGRFDRLADLAAELVDLKVDVMVTAEDPATHAVKRTTTMLPVVMATSGDPVGDGFITSFARPGGHITGLTLLSPGLSAKRLEVFQEILPKPARVAVLWNPANPFNVLAWKEMRDVARAPDLTLQSFEVRRPHDLDRTLTTLTGALPDGMVVLTDPLISRHLRSLMDFAAKVLVPVVTEARDHVDAGNLLAYHVSRHDLFRRSAGYVAKILKGGVPGDLPIEQPTRFELVVNLKTAKALGLTIPQSVLLRADEVIQ